MEYKTGLLNKIGYNMTKQLRAAAQVFDRNFAGDKPKCSLAEAAATWVDYFGTDSKEKAKSCSASREAAPSSSSLPWKCCSGLPLAKIPMGRQVEDTQESVAG